MEINEILSSFSEELRLRIALLLENSAICVNCLVEIFELPQSTVSRHLGILRRAHIIKAEKKGPNTYYSLDKSETDTGRLVHKLVKTFKNEIKNTEPFLEDRKRLEAQGEICGVECVIK